MGMIRSDKLIDKLVADLHFHHYLEIIGDDLYGQKSQERMMLHADKIIIPHPFENNILEISAISTSFLDIFNKTK